MFLGKAKAAVATRKMYNAKVVALFVRIVVPSIGRGGKQRERMLCVMLCVSVVYVTS